MIIRRFHAKSANLTLDEKETGRTKNRDRVAKKTDDNNSTSFREWQRPISLSIRIDGRSAPLAGASHVKQLFVYLSYPAGQLSSAISGTRLSSSNREVTTHTPCASTSVLASAPKSRITVTESLYYVFNSFDHNEKTRISRFLTLRTCIKFLYTFKLSIANFSILLIGHCK